MKKEIIFVGINKNYYNSIQKAIDEAQNNQTIQILPGIYKEKIIIKKPIKILGTPNESIIDGTDLEDDSILIDIQSNNVTIKGMTIQNAKGISSKGIKVQKKTSLSKNINLQDNTFKNCSYGIIIYNPIESIIQNNKSYGCTIHLYFDKKIDNKNIVENNNVNDKPSTYLINQKNLVISNKNVGFFSLYNCQNITIEHHNISNVTVGIDISFSKNIFVKKNKISNAKRGGIYVHHSNFCVFKNNELENNNWGIFLRRSNFNTIKNNNFIDIRMKDWFDVSFFNLWNNNFWNNPKKISIIIGKIILNMKWYNIDLHPLKNKIIGDD